MYLPELWQVKKMELWVKEQLDYYKGRHFILPDGTFDLTTNTQIISGIMESNGFHFEKRLSDI